MSANVEAKLDKPVGANSRNGLVDRTKKGSAIAATADFYRRGLDATGKGSDKKKEDAIKASQQAEANPATAQQAKNAKTADINDDGFVTLDEVAALEAAGLTDKDIIHKLQITQQVFELTPQQEQYLRDHDVTDTVIEAMRGMNRAGEGSGQLASEKTSGSERISKKAQ